MPTAHHKHRVCECLLHPQMSKAQVLLRGPTPPWRSTMHQNGTFQPVVAFTPMATIHSTLVGSEQRNAHGGNPLLGPAAASAAPQVHPICHKDNWAPKPKLQLDHEAA
jgi:hypothetical protein